MIIYEFNNNRFKKDGKRISKADVELQLKKYQLKTLLNNGKFKVRVSTKKDLGESIKSKKVIIDKGIIDKSKRSKGKVTSPNDKTKKEYISLSQKRRIAKVRDLYHIDYNFYSKLGWKYELWCKNKKGYSNFICYLDNNEEETIERAILQHLKDK